MTILIQGAMDSELDVLTEYFAPQKTKTIAGYDFYISSYKGNDIIVSKTEVGLINASVATTVGINEFRPALVINQGCAGGHVPDIKNGELVIGEKSVYINNFYTNPKGVGEGSNSLDWYPCKRSYVVPSTPEYVKLADGIDFDNKKRIGILGSGDLFSKEVDRINYMHSLFGELCEDMESVAALKVCDAFGVNRLALRIISNNEITLEAFDYGVCKTMQKFVIALVDKIICA
ncbi:MAG: 5'-methylthioadenosine/S-adenosylhomocysteine nucleosidase [Clostridiales bacterium]|nr:5'-methylthioadenosine/S-adenosylhomocysteine nucleosidase [Clostridiales bacterium]